MAGGGGGVAALVLAEGPGPERQCNRPSTMSWLLFTPRRQARLWQGESLEIGQDDRGASPSPPALPLLPTFAFA